MSYYFSKALDAPFDDAAVRAKAALAREGFGVISEIDIRQTLKTKIGVEFRPTSSSAPATLPRPTLLCC